MQNRVIGIAAAIVTAAFFCGGGCAPETGDDSAAAGGGEVVVYTALDRGFSEPILKEFEEETGIKVRPKYDTEHTKTVGLVNSIRNEKSRPRCDVFWNNEIVNTIRLKREDCLAPYKPAAAEPYPQHFKDDDGYWHGFAGRARVLLVNTDIVADDEMPDSIYDLLDPKWKGRIAIAKPLFGTTATHVACLFEHLGPEKAKKFLLDLKANDVQVEAGNKGVATGVSSGKLAFGLTDTDDAIIEVESGKPVKIVHPDGGPEQMGDLFIPNTLAVIKDCPNRKNAEKLVEYLLSPEVEARLARAESAQIPLNPNVNEPTRVKTPKDVKALPIDFGKAAARWDAAAVFIKDHFLQ